MLFLLITALTTTPAAYANDAKCVEGKFSKNTLGYNELRVAMDKAGISEKEYLARVIYSESGTIQSPANSGNCKEEKTENLMRAIGWSVRNRVEQKNPLFGVDYKGVILKPRQYTSAQPGVKYGFRCPQDEKRWAAAQAIAEEVMEADAKDNFFATQNLRLDEAKRVTHYIWSGPNPMWARKGNGAQAVAGSLSGCGKFFVMPQRLHPKKVRAASEDSEDDRGIEPSHEKPNGPSN